MRRREIITLLGGAVTLPLAARAQTMSRLIGFLSARSAASGARMVAAFRQGLNEAGYIEGKNLVIEYRWAGGRFDRLAALAKDLVRRRVAVIGALSGTPAALAARAATTEIPIVFGNGGDPLASGLVTSLSRPTGNMTGVTFYTVELAGKRLELLRNFAPAATVIGLLYNPNNPAEQIESKNAMIAAQASGVHLKTLEATNDNEIDSAFASLTAQHVGALIVGSDPLFLSIPQKIVALVARYRLPAIYSIREFVEAGGLISYGSKQSNTYRQAGVYVGKILQGAKPSDLPIMQPTAFELVVNLKAANALGLTVPQFLLVSADAVIE